MKPATHLTEVVTGLYRWSGFHPQWKIDFSSYALRTRDGVLFFDPLKPTPAVAKKLAALGEPIAICLTDANHGRDADWFRRQFSIQVYAHEKAKADCDVTIDVLVLDGERLPGGVKTIHLPGPSAGSVAFHSKQAGGIVVVGDALLHLPVKGLALLPEQYLDDRRQLNQSLRRLLDLNFKCMTFAHGEPLVENAKSQLARFLRKSKKAIA